MNRFKIGVIVFFAFISGNAAGSNPSFNDTISIPGAKCTISIPMDSNSLFSSFEHPCTNYYFFKLRNYFLSFRGSNLLMLGFTSSIKCTLFVKSVQFSNLYLPIEKPPSTLPISCDSLPYYSGDTNYDEGGIKHFYQYNGPSVVPVNDSIRWAYEGFTGKRLAKAKQILTEDPEYGDLLHLILNAYVLSSHCLNYISGKESIYAGKIHGA